MGMNIHRVLQNIPGCLRLGLSWFKWWVSFAPEFQCCYFCESSCLFYVSFNFDLFIVILYIYICWPKVGIGTIPELSCAKKEVSFCCAKANSYLAQDNFGLSSVQNENQNKERIIRC